LQSVADKLLEAVVEGYGKDLTTIEYGSPDWEMVKNLHKNVYAFSGAKNYRQLKTMTMALTDAEGNLVSFAEFKKTAFEINDQYNKIWLQTEYDTAIGSSQMAGKWAGFEEDSMLEYITIGDERVRVSHQSIDGVLKLKSDPFWLKFYPPNGWRCRCNVRESLQEEETPDDDFTPPAVPEMFQTNMAKEGLLFPKGHPYYKGLPKEVLKQAEELRKTLNNGD
jgi:hypothetical protein